MSAHGLPTARCTASCTTNAQHVESLQRINGDQLYNTSSYQIESSQQIHNMSGYLTTCYATNPQQIGVVEFGRQPIRPLARIKGTDQSDLFSGSIFGSSAANFRQSVGR